MKKRRYTIPNPGTKIRFKMLRSTDEPLWVRYMGTHMEVYGEIINILGDLEDAKPIEEWLEDAKRIKKEKS